MALLNGKPVSFSGLSFAQIGEEILEASPTGDGKGITLELAIAEERAFESFARSWRVGYGIAELIADAVEKKTQIRPTGLAYRYSDQVFTT